MLKALLWKEFREMLPVCIAAPALELVFAGTAVNGWRQHRAADVWAIYPLLYLLVVILPLIVGYWQTAPEDNNNSFQFLLHRPTTRTQVFGAKLLFGFLVCLAFCVAPMCCFIAFLQGAFPDRTATSLASLWPTNIGIWLLYMGSFLSGLRPASSFRSRFVPLFAGIFLFAILHIFSSALLPRSFTAAFSLVPLTLIVVAGFVFVALHVGKTRDYS